MEKKNKWEKVLMGVFLVLGIACAVFLIIFSNEMFLNGSTNNLILGVVLLSVGFLVSTATFSALLTSYRFNKNKPLIKYEEVQDSQNNQEQSQQDVNQK